jgi:hypothetical protein
MPFLFDKSNQAERSPDRMPGLRNGGLTDFDAGFDSDRDGRAAAVHFRRTRPWI